MTSGYNNSEPLGRIRLLLRLDRQRYLRPLLLPALGIYALFALIVWLGIPLLQDGKLYSVPDDDGFWLWSSLSLLIGIGAVGYYLNASVQHAGAVAFASLPARLREKGVVMLVSSAITFASFFAVYAFTAVLIYLIRSKGTFSLEVALGHLGDFASDVCQTLKVSPNSRFALLEDHDFWGQLSLYAFCSAVMALLVRLALGWQSYVKAVFVTGVAGIVSIVATILLFVQTYSSPYTDDPDKICSMMIAMLALWSVVALLLGYSSYRVLRRVDR